MRVIVDNKVVKAIDNFYIVAMNRHIPRNKKNPEAPCLGTLICWLRQDVYVTTPAFGHPF